mgnify:CR=1 FL=1
MVFKTTLGGIMLFIGIILLILGILGRVFASVSHITDTTTKAMGWIILNKIVSILAWGSIVVGGLLILGSVTGGY